MVLCSKGCFPCCDFCLHVIYEEWDDEKGHHVGGPEKCSLHSDIEHQEIAESDGYCEDFHCHLADQT